MRRLVSAAIGLGLVVSACAGNEPAARTALTSASTGTIGAECRAHDDCSSGLFCKKDEPGGQCVKKCSSSVDCGPGAVCSEKKMCHRVCQTVSDCPRSGFACKGAAPNTYCDTSVEEDENRF
jgi:hypothetical protein